MTMGNRGNMVLVCFGLAISVALATYQALAVAENPIDRLIAPAKVERPRAGIYRYAVAMSKDEKLCSNMASIFNGDLERYGYEDFAAHGEFSAVQWQPVQVSVNGAGRGEKRDAAGSLLDIDNDGTANFVVKWSLSLSGVLHDAIYVLSAARASHDLTSQELFTSPNRVNGAGWAYRLQPPFESHEVTFVALEPFVFEGKTYLYMRPMFELSMPIADQYAIIGRYNGGRVDIDGSDPNAFSDVCYFQRVRKKPNPKKSK